MGADQFVRHHSGFLLSARPPAAPSVGHIYGVAVAIGTPAMPAQGVYHPQAIRTKPFVIAHPFHFCPLVLAHAHIHQLIRRSDQPLGCIAET